jgi:hypothetical protein
MNDINQIPAKLIEVGESFEPKYKPVLDFEGWRVAMLRKSVVEDNLSGVKVERHNETNEVFILTAGEADMIVCDEGDIPGKMFIIKMEDNVAYNILRAVWHQVIMSKDAHIIIFEKTDTTVHNSDYFTFDEKTSASILQKIRETLRRD